jgi:hypothetical protein
MAFMRSAHAENILCRVACNRRTIVRQMPTNATAVTRLNHDEHIADTGVERNIFLEIFLCERAAASWLSARNYKIGLSCPAKAGHPAMMVWRLLDRPPSRAMTAERQNTGLRGVGLSRSLFLKREAGQPPARDNKTGGLPCDC